MMIGFQSVATFISLFSQAGALCDGYRRSSGGTRHPLRKMLKDTPKDTEGDYMTGSGLSYINLINQIDQFCV